MCARATQGRNAWTSSQSIAAESVRTPNASHVQHYTASMPSNIHIVAILHDSFRNVDDLLFLHELLPPSGGHGLPHGCLDTCGWVGNVGVFDPFES